MCFQVQKTMCSTCIYRPDSPLDLLDLELQVKDSHGFFNTYRACHHSGGDTICCRGFWDSHKDGFQMGQIAQRLNLVEFVVVDIPS